MGPGRVLFKSVVLGALFMVLVAQVGAPTEAQVSVALPPIPPAGATSTLTLTPRSANTPTSTGTPDTSSPTVTPTGTQTPVWGCPGLTLNPSSLHVPYRGGQYTIQVEVGANCYWYDDPGISWLRY